MECDNMDMLMMKYMDGAINAEEEKLLHVHMEKCEKCHHDYLIYEELMRDLPSQTIFAPDNFEDLVMKRIYALPENKKFAASVDKLLFAVWGILFALLGCGIAAALNKDAIVAYLTNNPSLHGYADLFLSAARVTESAGQLLSDIALTVSSSVSGYITSSRYMLMLIIAVLAMVQFVVYRSNKAEI